MANLPPNPRCASRVQDVPLGCKRTHSRRWQRLLDCELWTTFYPSNRTASLFFRMPETWRREIWANLVQEHPSAWHCTIHAYRQQSPWSRRFLRVLRRSYPSQTLVPVPIRLGSKYIHVSGVLFLDNSLKCFMWVPFVDSSKSSVRKLNARFIFCAFMTRKQETYQESLSKHLRSYRISLSEYKRINCELSVRISELGAIQIINPCDVGRNQKYICVFW